jgi:uncharacterized membrane protein YhhN
VNSASAVLLVLAALFALGDWWSRLRDRRRVEYVCKPATLALLIATALTLDPADGAGDRRAWFVAALVFSLAGDVFLMLPRDLFVPGLAAFLLGHVCYVIGFWTDPPAALAVVVAALVIVGPIGWLAVRVIRSIRDRVLVGPVIAYISVISAMVVSALASGNVAAGTGAVLFAGSDSLIAWDRFVRPLQWAPVAIMVTYHVGQALLVLSLLD